MDATPVGALYDSLLQSALRQFFERATLDTEPTASGTTDGRLAIEPSANPSALIIRWFGTRYTLRVPGRWPFTAHEVRLAQAIGAVLAARYRAIQNPRILAERGGSLQRPDRGPVRRRVSRPAVLCDRRPRDSGRPDRLDHRDAARRRAFQLRESSDLDRRAAAGHQRRSRSAWNARDVCRPVVYRGTDTHQELLPDGRRRSHAVPGEFGGEAPRHHRHQTVGWHRASELVDLTAVPTPCPCHAAARARMRCAQPVARDQDLRGRDRDVYVPGGRLASRGCAGQIPSVGGCRRRRPPGSEDLSDGPRFVRGARRGVVCCCPGARSRCRRSSLLPPIGSICRCANPMLDAMDRKSQRAAISCTCWSGGRLRIWIRASSWDLRRSTAQRLRIDPAGFLPQARSSAIHHRSN